MSYLGIDIGSLSCDAVLLDDDENILAFAVVPTGARNQEAIGRARREVLERAGREDAGIRATVSTGYGRDRVQGRQDSVTEITCHACGIQKFFPQTKVLIDIGGQDSKAIAVSSGKVIDFAMNDKCAAGTGRFLEAMSRALEVDIDDLGELDMHASGTQTISSMCTVFAESEVVGLVARGSEVAEIANGINRAIAARTFSLARRIYPGLRGAPVAMSGGVARNSGVVRALSILLERPIDVPAEPDIVGALGAALIARRR
jgi:predicted CoA-substrate-specific enzyme activase